MSVKYSPIDFLKYRDEDGGGFIVEGETFTDSSFTGPMVFAVSWGCTFTGGRIDHFGSILEISNDDLLCGVIIVRQCTFINCDFKNVQFGSTLTVKQDLIDAFINDKKKTKLTLVT